MAIWESGATVARGLSDGKTRQECGKGAFQGDEVLASPSCQRWHSPASARARASLVTELDTRGGRQLHGTGRGLKAATAPDCSVQREQRLRPPSGQDMCYMCYGCQEGACHSQRCRPVRWVSLLRLRGPGGGGRVGECVGLGAMGKGPEL